MPTGEIARRLGVPSRVCAAMAANARRRKLTANGWRTVAIRAEALDALEPHAERLGRSVNQFVGDLVARALIEPGSLA